MIVSRSDRREEKSFCYIPTKNQKIKKSYKKYQKRKKRREREEKFEINLQIQPFDFEISCSKYQKEREREDSSLLSRHSCGWSNWGWWAVKSRVANVREREEEAKKSCRCVSSTYLFSSSSHIFSFLFHFIDSRAPRAFCPYRIQFGTLNQCSNFFAAHLRCYEPKWKK